MEDFEQVVMTVANAPAIASRLREFFGSDQFLVVTSYGVRRTTTLRPAEDTDADLVRLELWDHRAIVRFTDNTFAGYQLETRERPGSEDHYPHPQLYFYSNMLVITFTGATGKRNCWVFAK